MDFEGHDTVAASEINTRSFKDFFKVGRLNVVFWPYRGCFEFNIYFSYY